MAISQDLQNSETHAETVKDKTENDFNYFALPVTARSTAEFTCQDGCDCLESAKCKWSVDLIVKLEDARNSNNGKLFHSYIKQFRKHICSFEEQKVCCCGTKQITSDELEMSKSSTSGTIASQM